MGVLIYVVHAKGKSMRERKRIKGDAVSLSRDVLSDAKIGPVNRSDDACCCVEHSSAWCVLVLCPLSDGRTLDMIVVCIVLHIIQDLRNYCACKCHITEVSHAELYYNMIIIIKQETTITTRILSLSLVPVSIYFTDRQATALFDPIKSSFV